MGVVWSCYHAKLKRTKIYSKGFWVWYTKICTNENFPLYGTNVWNVSSMWHTSDALWCKDVPSLSSCTIMVDDISTSMRGRKLKKLQTIVCVSVEGGCVLHRNRRGREERVWREGVCIAREKGGKREYVCTLCLASIHMPHNALHIHVHVSLTGTIIQYQLMYMYVLD